MTGRSRADLLVALNRSRTERATVLDQLLGWQAPADTARTLTRLDALDAHIGDLLDDYLKLGPQEAT